MRIKLYTLPNFITLCNLLCGSLAVLAAVGGELKWAFWLILAAAVFDFLDGFTARLLHSYSEVGAQLDSLSDMVSFGLAPTIVLLSLYDQAPSLWGWNLTLAAAGRCLLFAVVAFSALRLARFNVDTTQSDEFRGLPVPANALLLASLGLLAQTHGWQLPQEALTALALVMAWLLVSPVRMFALKFHGFALAGNELRYGFILGCIMLALLLGVRAVPLIIVLYIVISTIRWILCPTCRKKDGQAAA